MYIEDIIFQISTKSLSLNRFDKNIVESFADQIYNSKGFTEKQANLALKICKKYLTKINLALGTDITNDIECPVYKYGLRTINSNKKMSIQEDDNREKFINVEFPYNEDILKLIREKRDKFLSANWDGDSKSWKFSLDERSLIFLSEIRTKFSFDIDDELENYFLKIKNIISNIEHYVPMVVIADTKLEFKNIPLKFPEKIEKSITDAIFYARKMGVYTWDEEIQQVLTANFSKSGIDEFLNTDPGQRFFWDTEKYQEKDAYELIKYLKPCLFIVPVDKELEISQKILENIRQIGILNEETSIMFRLPSETGSNFNEFVKTERLNNPITDKTKAVLVSGKIPKTILMKNIKFHCIFNYNIYNVHYTVQEFVKFHENVIHFTPKKEQQDILW